MNHGGLPRLARRLGPIAIACLVSMATIATPGSPATAAPPPKRGNVAASQLVVPPEATILSGLTAGHPRLILTAAGVTALQQRIAADPQTATWYAQVKVRANALIGTPVLTYTKPDGIRLLEVSREAVRRMYDLGLVYLVEGDPAIRDRAWAELAAVTTFPDWNPLHFLDTAEMTHAVSIGYDWLYAGLSQAQRTQVEQAIITMGLGPGRDSYSGNAPLAVNYWVVADHNWNNVVNGGELIGALAVGDVDPALAAYIAHNALTLLPNALARYGPDGGWPEGVSYWEYATEYTVYALASMQTALGTDFGFSTVDGFDRTGEVPIHLTGPTGQRWNWADDGEPRFAPNVPAMFWLADRFGREAFRAYQVAHAEPSALDVVWYRPPTGPAEVVPLDRLFSGIGVATSRTSWTDPGTTWVGAKGGNAGFNHNQLDLGSFVFESQGERWAIDLGREDYGVSGYFQAWPGGPRWDYYRSRAEGHNTLVIDPDLCEDQDPRAQAAVTRWETASDGTIAVTDLAGAYRGTPVRRGVGLFDRDRPGNETIVVQDELDLPVSPATSDVWWFMHTRAQIAITDAGRTATLTQNGKSVRATLMGPAGATFSDEPAVALPTSPQPSGNSVNTGVRKLAVHLAASGPTTITVAFDAGNGAAPAQVTPLASWALHGSSHTTEQHDPITVERSPNPCKGITANSPVTTAPAAAPIATPAFTG